MDSSKDLRLAVLIDADNVPHRLINGILEEIAKYGVPTFKRIYADWTKPHVAGWKAVLLDHAITPVQQYSYTTGKNSSDSALIIDAMDILHSVHPRSYPGYRLQGCDMKAIPCTTSWTRTQRDPRHRSPGDGHQRCSRS